MAIIIKRKVSSPQPEAVVDIRPREKRQAPERLDRMCLHVLGLNPNSAIPWWLMASYLYYHHDISLLSDGLYDDMAKAMLEAWGELEHMHKHLITLEHLKAGSLFDIPADRYPVMTRGGASHLVKGEMGLSITIGL